MLKLQEIAAGENEDGDSLAFAKGKKGGAEV
jgi:hypothetical protein